MKQAVHVAILLLLIAAPAAVGAQTSPPASPPVLSTVPSPSNEMPAPSQMSGLPLQVGDLPPGIVVVRVIRRSFQENVPGQAVQLRVSSTGRVSEAPTGPDGRARFDGLTVGQYVQVRTTFADETLVSQPFEIPSQAGVRVVLAAGVGAGMTSLPPWPAASAADPSAATSGVPSAPLGLPSGELDSYQGWRRTGIITGLVLVGGAVLAILSLPRAPVWPKPVRANDPEPNPAGPAATADRPRAASNSNDRQRLLEQRAALFESLVRLAKSHDSVAAADGAHAARREALVERLIALDRHLEELAAN